ncbi:FkbM family methyltransferase, partial [Sphingorhabdus sp.]|uniref:FkbM family methyltransferase n=1 Tax=Sphingorhabdus sp. TaxID=1902408 RepID=UPI00333F10E3
MTIDLVPANPIGLSYAQNYEDVLLWRALGHVKEGRYLDIGACDPIADSVSKAFYLAGWRGVHVDPSATYADALRKDRPDEIVIQAVVGDEPGFVTFYEFPDTGLSTCVEEFADRHRAAGHACEIITAPVIALAELLDLAAGSDLHWLKIDVEGFERKVLSSWGQSSVRPWVLLIESTEPNSQIQTQCEWIDLVHELGYHEVAFDGLSRFYVSDAHCELDAAFIANPNIFDSFNVTKRHFSSRALVGEWRAERDRLMAAMTNCEAQAVVDRDAFEKLLAAAHEQVEAGRAAAFALQKELQNATIHAESIALDNASLTAERDDLEGAMQARAIEVASLAATADAISQERDRLVSEAGAFYDKLASQKADYEAIEKLLADVHLDNASLRAERGDLEGAMQARAIEVASLAATADAISQERDR